MLMRPNMSCSGSKSSAQSFLPDSIARSGFSGRFVRPWMLAISLYRNSRMKKDFDRRILPKSSAPFTDFGVRTLCLSEHPGTAVRELLPELLVLGFQLTNPAADRI